MADDTGHVAERLEALEAYVVRNDARITALEEFARNAIRERDERLGELRAQVANVAHEAEAARWQRKYRR